MEKKFQIIKEYQTLENWITPTLAHDFPQPHPIPTALHIYLLYSNRLFDALEQK